ncbi:MAG: hypothetical protein J5959_13105 [Butyrivibrio sp.]|nr:hypothetical protein [Butyrivibrio sp.]
MSMLCGGGSDSAEEAVGVNNFFATREAYEISFDLKTWYREGDNVYYAADGEERVKSEIIAIYEDGGLLLKNEKGTFILKAGSVMAYQISSGDNEECGHGSVLAVKERLQFSVDLKNWFSVGQKCIISTSEKTYARAEIRNIFDGGKILIENEGDIQTIDYSVIGSIQDYYENTRIILAIDSKKPTLVLTYTPKYVKPKKRRIS